MSDSSVSPKPTSVRWIIFTLACAASWMLYLHRYSWGIIKPAFRREYPELTDVEIGWLDSAFLATYAFGQVPGGIAGDLFGPRIVLSVLMLIGSLATVGVAWTTGFWRLFSARAAFGLAQAGVYPVLSKITRTWFPLSSRTTVQGMVTAMGRIGAASAPVIIATWLLGVVGLSWQNVLLALMIPGIVLSIGFWFAIRNHPREHPWMNEAEQDLLDPSSIGATLPDDGAFRAGEPPTTAANPTQRPILHLTAASMFSLGMMLVYAFASTFQDQFYVNWLPSFLVDPEAVGGKNIGMATMGLFVPFPLIGGAIGGVLGGFLNDYLIRRTGNHRWSRTGVAFTGKIIGAVMVLVAMQMEDGRMVMAMLVAARVFSDWSLPTQWAAVTDMGGRAAATVFGIVNTVGALGGFAAGPIFGYLKQEYGYDGIFYGVAAMCILAAVTWLGIDCTKRLVSD
jgi:MFS family permease